MVVLYNNGVSTLECTKRKKHSTKADVGMSETDFCVTQGDPNNKFSHYGY